MQKDLFHYVGPARHAGKSFTIADIVVVSMSSMPEKYNRAVFLMSAFAYDSGYVDTLNNPLYLFRVKSLKIPIYDHIPGF